MRHFNQRIHQRHYLLIQEYLIKRRNKLIKLQVTLLFILLYLLVTTPITNAQEPDPPLNPFPTWSGGDGDLSEEVAWGDVDGDGDLDLAIANNEGNVKVYFNENGILQTSVNQIWESTGGWNHESVAWGDIDGDGDLDLAIGELNEGSPNQIYINDNGSLQAEPFQEFGHDDETYQVAWGDVNGDGDLDLATGNREGPNKVYLNVNGTLQINGSPYWESGDSDTTRDIAWGDVDGDGDLDLAAGNSNFNKVYLNINGTLQTAADEIWQSNEDDNTHSVAWGDVDGDGDLDLLAGNRNEPNRLYINNNGSLEKSANPAWEFGDDISTADAAWGDMDNDGDLDVAVGSRSDPNALYLNNGLSLTAAGDPFWTSQDESQTEGIAWGDVDGDGDLDLAAANSKSSNLLYNNMNGVLQSDGDPLWTSDTNGQAFSLAWGDVDNDGDLDLAIGRSSTALEDPESSEGMSNVLYLNHHGILQTNNDNSWVSSDNDVTFSVAWGDVDNDGDLDLAVGNYGAPNKLYLNDGGQLQSTTPLAWQSDESDNTYSVAWADVDNDGDLDLAVGNYDVPNKLYLNDGGQLQTTPAWMPSSFFNTTGVAWGDVDDDGDLDLAVGNYSVANSLYLNENGVLQTTRSWISNDSDFTYSVAWGDVDGDGDLDLAAGNWFGPNKVYLNVDGVLQTSDDTPWNSGDSDNTIDIHWGDVDGDGDLDLAAANWGNPNKIYLNNNGVLQTMIDSPWLSVDEDETAGIAWGDVDGDGDLDLAAANYDAPSKIYRNGRPGRGLPNNATQLIVQHPVTPAVPNGLALLQRITDLQIPIQYSLFDLEDDAIGHLALEYSPNGGGQWFPAIGVADTPTSNLATQHKSISTPAMPLVDGNVVSHTLNLNQLSPLINPEVTLSISHTHSAQISARLVSSWPAPTGTIVHLFNGISRADNLMLSDQAKFSIDNVIYPNTDVPLTSYFSTDVPQAIPASGTPTISSTLIITNGPTSIIDVNVINLTGTHTYIGDLDVILQGPDLTQVILLDQICGTEENFALSFSDEADVTPPPCPPADGETYQSEDSLTAFDGKNSNGTWTLIIKDRSNNDGGELHNWGLQFNDATSAPFYGTYQPQSPLAALNNMPADWPVTLVISDSIADGSVGTLESVSLLSGAEHIFTWDTFASGFFGQSENMVLRMLAYPQPPEAMPPGSFTFNNVTPGLVQRPYASAQTLPFRMRGTQIQVISKTDVIPPALVYRLPNGQTGNAEPYRRDNGELTQTGDDGYLLGRGQLALGDQLVAMLPVLTSDDYTLYHTSAAPSETGLDMYTVSEPGVQVHAHRLSCRVVMQLFPLVQLHRGIVAG
ncbi:MAG: FG-GAP-like repeat-containing protein, partial [Chloroflexota bacterium]